MSYHRGLPTNSDCLGYLAKCRLSNRCIEILYHTTKIENIVYDPELGYKIYHIPAKHKPYEFEIIKVNDQVQ